MNPCWFYTISSFRDIPRMKCRRFFSKCRSRHKKVPRMVRKERRERRNSEVHEEACKREQFANSSNSHTQTDQDAMHNDANNINCCNESVTMSTEMIYVNCFWYTFIHDRCTLISFFSSPSQFQLKISKRLNCKKEWKKKFWGTNFSFL